MIRTAQIVVAIAVAACASSTPAPAPLPATQPSARPVPIEAAASRNDETVLSARRFVYASYFHRLKRRVGTAWNPALVWKALPEAQRTSLGTVTRETVVRVALSTAGELTALELQSPSGVAELDAEALRAFQVSSPFGATPKGQELKPFNFSFFFEIGSGTSSTTIGP